MVSLAKKLSKICHRISCVILFFMLITCLNAATSKIDQNTFAKSGIQWLPPIKEWSGSEPLVIATEQFIFLYGGFQPGSSYVYHFDSNRWEAINAEGLSLETIIPIRSSAIGYAGRSNAITAKGRYLFAWGLSSSGSRLAFHESNDGWIYDSKLNRWHAIPLENAPFPRKDHFVIAIRNGILVYGGATSGKIDFPPISLFSQISYMIAPTDPIQAGWLKPLYDGGIFDTEQNKWIPVHGPEGWIPIQAAAWKEKIVFIMYKFNEKIKKRAAFIFDPGNRSWSEPIYVPDDIILGWHVTSAEKGIIFSWSGYIWNNSGKELTMVFLHLPEAQWEVIPAQPLSHFSGLMPISGSARDSLYFLNGGYMAQEGGKNTEDAYQAWKYDFKKKLWFAIRVPVEIPYWQDRDVCYISDKNDFLLLDTGRHKEVSGILWNPLIYEDEPINLNGWPISYSNSADTLWTGKYLIGLQCGKQIRCHGFVYKPTNNKWWKVPLADAPQDVEKPRYIAHKSKIYILDGKKGDVFSLDFIRWKWDKLKITLPFNEFGFMAYEISEGIIISYEATFWLLEPDSLSLHSLKIPFNSEHIYMGTSLGLARLKTEKDYLKKG